MADDADRAQEVQEQHIRTALQNRVVIELKDNGICHYCSDPIKTGHFCSPECRDDYEKINRGQKSV